MFEISEPLIRKKTIAERDAENAWWRSLSQTERDDWLRKDAKERSEREAVRTVIVGIAIAIYIVIGVVPIIVMAMRMLF